MSGASTSLMDRMKGAAMLDIDTFEAVEHDTGATLQAAMVVVLASVAGAVGSWNLGIGSALGAAVASLLSWGVWAGVTYLIGDKLLGGTATWGELLRTIGFAYSPAVLLVLAILPVVGAAISVVVAIWVLIAVVIAIRQALDFSTSKAVLTAVLGWLPYGFIMAMLRY